jgi:hypothetical protein
MLKIGLKQGIYEPPKFGTTKVSILGLLRKNAI